MALPEYDSGGQAGGPQYQLDLANKQLKEQQAKVKLLQTQMKALKKPSPKDKRATAVYTAKISAYNAKIGALNATVAGLQKSIPELQNKVWELSGQYDKLLTGANRDAFMALTALFKSYGLESLAPKIYNYVKNGESADTISIQLQDTSEYKARFAGNERRKAAGLAVLSPAEYLSTETAFNQIIRASGLPPGLYDTRADFADWIGKNISPTEIQSRVDLATQATILANPQYRQALNAMGIDDAHLTAYFLDSTRALPYLQKAAATAQVGAEALRQNLLFDVGYAEQVATMGISAEQARAGYQQIASELDTMKSLGAVYGEEWSQRTSEQATLEGQSDAVSKQRRLLSRERGAFSGTTGAGRGGLAQQGGAR